MFDLGTFLELQRKLFVFWRKLFFAALALFVVVNIFIRPAEPHFGFDSYTGFWAVFGLGVGLIMVFAMKRIIQPLIVRKEDYYGDL